MQKNLYAFTEPSASLPAYISVNRLDGEEAISFTVRAQGEQYGSSIRLTEQQVYQLALSLLKALP